MVAAGGNPATPEGPGRPGPERPGPTGSAERGGTPGRAARAGDATTGGQAVPPADDGTPVTQQLGRVFVVILAILFGVFAVANSQAVDFSWVFGSTEVREDPTGDGTIGGVPLILLLLTAFVVGALISTFVTWQVHRRRRGSPTIR